jgi:hypothetical protein
MKISCAILALSTALVAAETTEQSSLTELVEARINPGKGGGNLGGGSNNAFPGKGQQENRGGTCPQLSNGQNCHTARNCERKVCDKKTGRVKQSQLARDRRDRYLCSQKRGGCTLEDRSTSFLEEDGWIFDREDLDLTEDELEAQAIDDATFDTASFIEEMDGPGRGQPTGGFNSNPGFGKGKCPRHVGGQRCFSTRNCAQFCRQLDDDYDEYNCNTKELWSKEKRKWCCNNEGKGCGFH